MTTPVRPVGELVRFRAPFREGLTDLVGVPVPDAPGLAVVDTEWGVCVFHLRSGGVVVNATSVPRALEIAAELGALADWTRPSDEIQHTLEYIEARYVVERLRVGSNYLPASNDLNRLEGTVL